MTFSLEYFAKRKQNVLQLLDHYAFLLGDLGKTEEQQAVREIKEQVLNESFKIVVVGEFSRGKSTFINALLGKKLLPSSALPTTTILNMIHFESEPSIRLHFRDERRKPVSLSEDQFGRIIAPMDPLAGDPESERAYQGQVQFLQSIRYADIGHPLAFCQDGVEIIDTPGVNDLDPAREQITNNIIPQSDAAVFLLSATKILSESEVSFLRDRLLANDIQKVFLVINFKDELKTEEDQRKVIDYATTHLQGIFHEPKLFLVSAKEALNARRVANGDTLKSRRGAVAVSPLESTGFVELEESMAEFLQYERGAIKLQKPILRVMKSIDRILDQVVTFERATLTHQMQDLQETLNALRPRLERVKQAGDEALFKLTLEMESEGHTIAKWYERELYAINAAALQAFEKFRHLSPDRIARQIENEIAPKQRSLHEAKVKKMKQAVTQVIERVSRTVNEEWAHIDAEVKGIWSAESKALTGAGDLPAEEGVSGSGFLDDLMDELEEAFDKSTSVFGKVALGAAILVTAVVAGITSFLSTLFGGDEKEKLRKQLVEQYEASKSDKLTSFKQEWTKLRKAVNQQYSRSLTRQLKTVEQQLQQAMENASLDETEIQRKLEVIHRQETRLVALRAQFLEQYQTLHRKTGSEESTHDVALSQN